MKLPKTFPELLDKSLSNFSANIAIVDDNGSLTYKEFIDAVRGVTSKLLDMGVGTGDHVGVDSDGRDLIILSYSVMNLGAVVVAVPRGLSNKERDELVDKCHLSVIITEDEVSHFEDELGILEEGSLSKTYTTYRKKGFIPLSVLSDKEKEPYRMIRSTSGTTGTSKGVMFTEESLFNRIEGVNNGLGLTSSDTVLWVLPMAYHFIVSIMLYLTYGAKIVIPKNSTAQSVVDSIKQQNPTFLYATEHFYRLLLSNCEKEDLDNVKKALATSAKLSIETSKKFFDKFGISIMQAYGVIEGGLLSVNSDKSPEKRATVGKVFDCYDLKIVDNNFKDVASGEIGSIVVRGEGFFDAYISDYKIAKDVMSDTGGWFSTGDLGSIDSDGFLTLQGRTKNIINCMGMKVFPEEIEEVLNSNPLVAESFVKAKKHNYLNEVPHAEIVLKDGSSGEIVTELIKHCSQRLSAYKIPRSFDVVDRIKKTDTGKILRQ